jgi:hypothetical protein
MMPLSMCLHYFGRSYTIRLHNLPNYKTTSKHGMFKVRVKLPEGAEDAIAVHAQNRVCFRDNLEDTRALQY